MIESPRTNRVHICPAHGPEPCYMVDYRDPTKSKLLPAHGCGSGALVGVGWPIWDVK